MQHFGMKSKNAQLISNMLALRPYQTQIVQSVRESYIGGAKAPLVVAPTGAGKTIIFSHIAASSSARSKRVLILVHRVELLRQTSEKLHVAGVDHGLINPLYTPKYYSPVQVASVQTLIKRLNKIQAPDLIIVDEAHHATAGTWRKIIAHYPKALILGVTATPCRGDGTGLGAVSGGIFDTLVMGPQIRDLINAGYLVSPKVYAPLERLDLSKVHSRMGDYVSSELEQVIDKPVITGHAVKHYRDLCDGAPAVAFCVSIKHAEHVAEEFRAAGYVAYALDGSHDDEYRKKILAGLGSGKVNLVASCDLISEGTDIPAIGCAILLRPTQSLGLYLQQVGRALRPAKGKDRAIILDHVGNVLNHGMPDDEREWSLEGEDRRKKREKSEPTIKVEQCEQCYAVYAPAPACPSCGFIRQVADNSPKQVEGQLQEVTAMDRAALARQKKMEVGQAKSREELEDIARRRGYKPGWVNHQLRHREQKALEKKMSGWNEVI
jgi:DNA repair protein RadD